MTDFVIADGVLEEYQGRATHVNIPAGIRVIGDYAFEGSDVESVTVPEGVEKILGSAFKNCTHLRQVTLPSTLTLIGSCAFLECTALEAVTLPKGLTTLGPFSFHKCTALRQIAIPEGIRVIDHFAFCRCTGLRLVQLPEGVERIARAAFGACPSLTSVTLPASLKEIEKNALTDCHALREIHGSPEFFRTFYPRCREAFDEEILILIGLSHPEECPWIAEKVCDVPIHAMKMMARRKRSDLLPAMLSLWEHPSRALCDELLSYAEGAEFAELRTLLLSYAEEHFPTEETERLWEERIDRAFGLQPMTEEDWKTVFRYEILRDGNVRIKEYLGSDWIVYLPRRIGGHPVAWVDSETFLRRKHLSFPRIGERGGFSRMEIGGIAVDEENEYFSSIDGNLYSRGGEQLIYYAGGNGETHFTLPAGVKGIAPKAFYRCAALESVTLPKGVTEISTLTFAHAEHLRHVSIPKSLVWIGDGAFFGCTALESLTLPARLSRIGKDAFIACTSLTSVEIPDGVKKLGMNALRECTSLTHVRVGEGIEKLENYVFKDCTSLRSVTLSRGIRYVSGTAFEGCPASLEIRYEGSAEEWARVKCERKFPFALTFAAE